MNHRSILIVDPETPPKEYLPPSLYKSYTILEATNVEDAKKIIALQAHRLAIVLLEINNPSEKGFDLLDYMRFNRHMRNIPIIMMSAQISDADEVEGLRRGATDFVYKPFSPDVLLQRINNAIELFRTKRDLAELVDQQTEHYIEITDFMIDVLVSMMEVKNHTTRNVIQRICVYTNTILHFLYQYSADQYGLTMQTIDLITTASVLYDVGLLLMPDEYLKKHGQLTRQQREDFESHTTQGCKIIEAMKHAENEDYMNTAMQICRHHHERWDGSGYPDQLVGDEIPISAQVVGFADAYDNLRTGVLIGKECSHTEAMNKIEIGTQGNFSPVLIESAKIIGKQLDKIFTQDLSLDSYTSKKESPASVSK